MIFGVLRVVKRVPGLSGGAHRALLHCLEYADDDLRFFMSDKKLGEGIDSSRSAAGNYLRELVAADVLNVETSERRKVSARHGGRPAKSYRIVIAAEVLPDMDGKTGDDSFAKHDWQNSERVLPNKVGRVLPNKIGNSSLEQPLEDTGSPSSDPVSSSSKAGSADELIEDDQS